MAREGRSPNCFFRYDGLERKDIFLRINPQAVRVQQGAKGNATDTLGGYFTEQVYSKDRQYSGLMLPELTLEATTGIRYRKELEDLRWIWQHQSDRKPDGKPSDIYFFDLIEHEPFQGVERSGERIYLIFITNFAFDETVQSPNEIRMTFRCKILRDVLELNAPPPKGSSGINNIPNINNFTFAGFTQLPLPTR